MDSRLRGNDGVFAEPARMRFFTHKKVGTTKIEGQTVKFMRRKLIILGRQGYLWVILT